MVFPEAVRAVEGAEVVHPVGDGTAGHLHTGCQHLVGGNTPAPGAGRPFFLSYTAHKSGCLQQVTLSRWDPDTSVCGAAPP